MGKKGAESKKDALNDARFEILLKNADELVLIFNKIKKKPKLIIVWAGRILRLYNHQLRILRKMAAGSVKGKARTEQTIETVKQLKKEVMKNRDRMFAEISFAHAKKAAAKKKKK